MNVADEVRRAYEVKWSFINTFTVQILFSNNIKKFIGWDDKIHGEQVNLNIVSIDTPQYTNSNIEAYVGGRWRIHNGRDELYKFSITFRDQDQMLFYRKFLIAYLYQRTMYFDDIKMQIILSKDADYYSEKDMKLFTFEDVFIESISQLQFSNVAESQIAEFTVNFKCVTPTPAHPLTK